MRPDKTIALLLALALTGPAAAQAPSKNAKVLAEARNCVGLKVGEGKCGDFVTHCLRRAGAGKGGLGREVASSPAGFYPANARPGDVMKFEDATFAWDGGKLVFPAHAAIVLRVNGTRFTMLHSNFNGELTVREDEIDFRHLTAGRVRVYRPE